jgi:hypothetical protein
MIALPAYAAQPVGRNDDPRGAQGQLGNRGQDQRNDFRPGRNDSGRDANFQIRIGPGPVIARRPEPVRYETRTETVLVEPAHYEVRTETVLVREGHWEESLIPGRWEYLRDSYGNLHRVQITPDRVERTWCPPAYETRTVKVLVPARYETRTVLVPVYGRVDGRLDNRTETVVNAIGVGLQILDLNR